MTLALTDKEIRQLRALLAERPENLAPVPPAPVGSPSQIIEKARQDKEKRNGS